MKRRLIHSDHIVVALLCTPDVYESLNLIYARVVFLILICVSFTSCLPCGLFLMSCSVLVLAGYPDKLFGKVSVLYYPVYHVWYILVAPLVRTPPGGPLLMQGTLH